MDTLLCNHCSSLPSSVSLTVCFFFFSICIGSVKSQALIIYGFDFRFPNSPWSAFLNMGGFYLHAFEITAGISYLAFKHQALISKANKHQS